jgi:DNA repair protein RadC
MRVYEATLRYEATLFEVEGRTLDTPAKVYEYLKDIPAEYPHQETLWVVLLDRKNHPIFRIMVTKGTLTGSLVSPREVFTPALLTGAATVVVSHNHPSGDPAPSSADIQVTRALRDAGHILNIELTDHVILGDPTMDPRGKGWYSFREAGLV